MKPSTTPWAGASGTHYDFLAYTIDSDYPDSEGLPEFPSEPGVYIFSRTQDGVVWPIYIGSSMDLHGRIHAGWAAHGKRQCIVDEDPAQVHLYVVQKRGGTLQFDRTMFAKCIEYDLLAAHSFWSICN